MRTTKSLVAIALVTTLLAACSDDGDDYLTGVDTFTTPVFSMAGAAVVDNFRAHAHGEEEVPPVETRARGQAIFQLSEDGEALRYRLVVANIHDVLMAHIHRAPAGENGPVVAWLYPSEPPAEHIPGRTQGVLAEGVISADDLMGPLQGTDLEDLVAELRAGNGYVNVHTLENPGGEVRGQIR